MQRGGEGGAHATRIGEGAGGGAVRVQRAAPDGVLARLDTLAEGRCDKLLGRQKHRRVLFKKKRA